MSLTVARWPAVMSRRKRWGHPGGFPSWATFRIKRPIETCKLEGQQRAEEVLPLFFLHIAKTGGTSLSAALRAFYDAEAVISEGGNISVEFIKAHEHRLHSAAFIHGHARHAVMSYLMGRVRAITFLRDPQAQAVSNYLHVVRDLDNPLNRAAVNLGFTRFLTTFWQFAAFQLLSLDVSITRESVRFPEELEGRVGQVFSLLERMFFVGCLEQVNQICPLLSLLLGLPSCLTVPCLNTAVENGVDGETIARLRAEYETLQSDARIAHLLALERAVYNKAASLRSRYERRYVEQTFFAATPHSKSPYTAYAAANGAVYLAGNWRPVETTPTGPGWWTDSDECSTLLIDLVPAAHALEAEIYVTHFVNRLAFEADGLVLDHSLWATPDSNRYIRVDLRPLCCQQRRRVIVTLRLARDGGPERPPYYPALALRGFQLV